MVVARTTSRRRKAVLPILMFEGVDESHKSNRSKWVRSHIAR